MCGRFACSLCPDALRNKVKESNVQVSDQWLAEDKFYSSFNVGPRKNIPVVRRRSSEHDQSEIVMQTMRWGYIPCWAKQYPERQPINARDDTLSEGQSMFDRGKNKGRCIVVAEGFYEWKQLASGKKIPHYTKRKDGKLMLFAGLYDVSHLEGNDGQPLYTCTIITTSASSFFEFLHDRMPVILENGSPDVATWLSDEPWSKKHVQLMRPFEGKLDCYQVTDAVGSTKNNSPDFVVPVDQLKGSISNFFKKTPQQPTVAGLKREHSDDPDEKLVVESKKRDTKSSDTKKEKQEDNGKSKKKITSFFKEKK
ncbi:hypothetical protein BDB00DRAFT_857310 [Zychaea mexicana]|uniref:uncharacterized protein n=1 Tax=Zychaea mexicana TaxID=64656 RepID=UPI0022FE335E|nr:uncharacterized protein BDB00DRAFT_857310 [Zychaea mexicana]KAI9482545.1 hypothetical protein BDB00DRAFT_857310 [Zychaea mexicana]